MYIYIHMKYLEGIFSHFKVQINPSIQPSIHPSIHPAVHSSNTVSFPVQLPLSRSPLSVDGGERRLCCGPAPNWLRCVFDSVDPTNASSFGARETSDERRGVYYTPQQTLRALFSYLQLHQSVNPSAHPSIHLRGSGPRKKGGIIASEHLCSAA